MFATLRQDFSRYYPRNRRLSLIRRIQLFVDTPGLHAIVVYRLGRWIGRTFRTNLVRYPLLIVHWALQKLTMISWGIYIDDGADIGPGLYIGHFGGIIVGAVVIGEYCNINQQVTIGMRVHGSPGRPVIGNRVWIGHGSVVYGNVTIADGVTVAPCTVVSRSVPPKTLVSGNPMRVLAKDYDNSQAIFGTTGELPADASVPAQAMDVDAV